MCKFSYFFYIRPSKLKNFYPSSIMKHLLTHHLYIFFLDIAKQNSPKLNTSKRSNSSGISSNA